MRRPRAPLFLARRSYRRRRMHDAARLLPIVGAFLVLLPILWDPAESESRDTARDGIYLFGVWAGLILVAAAMAPSLNRSAENDTSAPGDED